MTCCVLCCARGPREERRADVGHVQRVAACFRITDREPQAWSQAWTIRVGELAVQSQRRSSTSLRDATAIAREFENRIRFGRGSSLAYWLVRFFVWLVGLSDPLFDLLACPVVCFDYRLVRVSILLIGLSESLFGLLVCLSFYWAYWLV